MSKRPDRKHDTHASGRSAVRPAAGFTLVEIILVIGIIATLMAILLPVTATIRNRSHEAECMSNLRQIFGAIETYRQRSNELPLAAPLPSGDPFAEPDGLNGALRNFLDPRSPVHLCPADGTKDSEVLGTSYFYVAGAFMAIFPPKPFPAARMVTQMFDGPTGRSIPILWDSEDRHFIGTDFPRNGLYIDGHTKRVGEPFDIPGS